MYLQTNDIEVIEKDTFQGLISLERLYIHSNKINNIHVQAFEHLENVKLIELSKNNLKLCDRTLFKKTTRIERLILDENPFTSKVLEKNYFEIGNPNCELTI